MTKVEATTSVLFGDLPSPVDEQFRMRQLTVWNWGTFSKLHTVRIADDGMLLLGPSGAGKSTLLDAISAMIVPPQLVHFNAAAEEGDRRGRDRNLMSYIRGAWAEKGEEGSREVAKQFLRSDATWSAIALEYGNRLGRRLTLVRLFWVTTAAINANINKHFMVVDGTFDLATELTAFAGDRRKLKHKLDRPEIRHHEDSFAAYQEHWCRIMGIEDISALELLHRTQSTKSLGDLNTFLRDFMLAEPETFGVAQRLVEEFADLDEAHRAVVAARQQIEVLAPARASFGEREQALASISANDALLDALTPFQESIRVGLLEQESRRVATEVQSAEGERDTIKTKLKGIQDEILVLERQHHEQGGGNLAAIESKIADLIGERERCSRSKGRAANACMGLAWALAEDAAGFAEQVASARAILDQARDRDQSIVARQGALAVTKRDQELEFAALRAEIKALESSSSNIPSHMQELRARLCTALSLPLAKVPFVGELLQVKADEQSAWAGAAERLLHGFAQALMIDEHDHKRVAKWVDETNLRGRLVYHPVPSGRASSGREPRPNSILHKLDRRPHAFASWLQRELIDRFDYDCVASPAELTKGDFRITQQGQIRHGRGRSEKDDRYDIRDRSRWVLGFDSREKLALYREKAHNLVQAMDASRRETEAIAAERQQDHVRELSAQVLVETEWRDIDVGTVIGRIAELEAQLVNVRTGNPTLAHLDGQLAHARNRRQSLQERVGELIGEIRAGKFRQQGLTQSLQSARVYAGALTKSHREALQARLPDSWTPTLDTVHDGVQKLERGLHEESRGLSQAAARLEGVVVNAFAEFLRRWPEEGGTFQAALPSAPDFFGKLVRVEIDGLPEYEARFLDLLRTQSNQRLAELSRHLSEARREITSRLADVNEALFAVPYNPDSYLRIRVVDLHLPEPVAFRQRLAEVFSNQHRQSTDQAEAEQQFEILRTLVLDLKADEPEKRRWRDAVLDVRRHVEFLADELERGSDRQIEVYSGSSGKSGGQRQKLTATCLAAALRYKLGGIDGGVPQYAAVVLDEAFTKTDNEFTATSMRIFTELGFQMIVATPIKSVMTLEEFVGGAVFVSISNRHTSALLHIEYDVEQSRLAWPEKARQQAAEQEVDADA